MVARSFFTRLQNVTQMILVRPKGSNRPPCPEEVKAASASIAADYEEACLVLPDSAKASAALSRRGLQQVLREKAQTTSKDLFDQIQEVLDGGKLPSHIEESLEAVRVIGTSLPTQRRAKARVRLYPLRPERPSGIWKRSKRCSTSTTSNLRRRRCCGV